MEERFQYQLLAGIVGYMEAVLISGSVKSHYLHCFRYQRADQVRDEARFAGRLPRRRCIHDVEHVIEAVVQFFVISGTKKEDGFTEVRKVALNNVLDL